MSVVEDTLQDLRNHWGYSNASVISLVIDSILLYKGVIMHSFKIYDTFLVLRS